MSDLLNRVDGDDIEELQEEIQTLNDDIVDLTLLKNKYRDRLELAADTLADLGIITNTPYAKRKWIEGE